MVVYPVMEEGKQLLEVMMVRMNNATDLQHIKTLQVQLQTVEVKLELSLAAWLLEFHQAVVPHKDIIMAQKDAHAAEVQAGAQIFLPTKMGIGMLYFEELILGPMQFTVSTSVEADGMDKMGVDLASSTAILSVASGVGVLMGNLLRVPLRLNGVNINDPFEPMGALIGRLVGNYKTDIAKFVARVFLGSEVLGNPIGLLEGVGTGVTDFFYEPAKGAIQSPEEFGKGLGRGGLSFLKGTLGGAFSLVGSTTHGISKVANTLGGGKGESSIQLFETASGEKPQGVLQGLGSAGTGVTQGIFDGVTGVFTKPVEGAMSGGVLGFAEGLGKGVLGLAAKPLGSIAGGVSDVMTGIAEDVQGIGIVKQTQVRRARWIALGGRVPAYDALKALGQDRLNKAVAHTSAASHELGGDHLLDTYLECGGGAKELFVTDQHMLHVDAGIDAGLKWWVFIHLVVRVDVSGTYVVIHCKEGASRAPFQRYEIECGGRAQAFCDELTQALRIAA
jgi:vacuolar protein sorting-associated protein 13A/C